MKENFITHKLSEQDINNFIQDYVNKNISIDCIEEKYNISRSTIYYYVRKYRIKHRGENNKSRKYNFSMNSFIKDSKEKYYWLGFISADGNITKNLSSLGIQLKSIDVKHLGKFKKFSKTRSLIKFFYTNAGKGTAKININSHELCEYLQEYNIVPNKSKIFTMPLDKIPEQYIFDYIRGLFDGDGSIYYREKQISLSFCSGNKTCMEQFNKTLGIDKEVKFSSGVFRIAITGNQKSKIFLDKIYKDSTYETRLDRKYEKYLSIYGP